MNVTNEPQPPVDDEPVSGESAPRNWRTRRSLILAGVAGVLLVGLVGVAATRSSLGPVDLTTASDPIPTTLPVPTTSELPVPTTTPATTSTTATGLPAPPIPPGPPVHFTATAGTLTIEVDVDHGSAATADVLNFTTTVTDAGGGELSVAENFGDTDHMSKPGSVVDCAPGPTSVPPESRKSWTAQHAYRKAGAYSVSFYAASSDCGRQMRMVLVKGLLRISPGRVLANGPLPLKVSAWQSQPYEQDPSQVYVGFAGSDADGYVSRLTLDWGDGSPLYVIDYPPSACESGDTYWPGSKKNEGASHQYTTSGSHSITVKAISAGCDGADATTATATVTVVAP